MRTPKLLPYLIAILYCLFSSLYAVITPPWESPDEPAHYLYVSQLAERWRPPVKSTVLQTDHAFKDQAYITSNYEWYQPMLGYVPAAIIYKGLEVIDPQNLPARQPQLSFYAASKSSPAAFFVHPGGGIGDAWRDNWGLLILRLFLALLGLPVILAAYKLGNWIEGENGFLGLVAAGWIAFLPQFTFINATVRSDTFTNAVAALAIFTSAWMLVSEKKSDLPAAITGCLLGLGLISKNTFIYLVPVGFLAILLRDLRTPRAWIRPGLFMLGPFLILWGGYLLVFAQARQAFAYTFTTALKINPALVSGTHVLAILKPIWIDLFYARFGWANVAPPAAWSWIAFGIWGAGFCLSLFQAVRTYRETGWSPPLKVIGLSFACLLLAFIGVVRFNLSIDQPQGRFLFPALLAWGVLGFWGMGQFFKRRAEKIMAAGLVGFMLLFNIVALFHALLPAYWG